MKKLFWLGITLFIGYELANVFFIMPIPGSQELNSIDIAYFLYLHRWKFRIIFSISTCIGLYFAKWKYKWIPVLAIIAAGVSAYLTNFYMAADHMFYQPGKLTFADNMSNQVDSNLLIIGVVHGSSAKAYPLRFIGYHHQVMDSIDGKLILVTYCTVCRSGRVYEPVLEGKTEKFRLVGMDHFNAMLEDETTKSWWRQATGEAIAGPLRGKKLTEVFSQQTTLADWLRQYPQSKIFQADSNSIKQYPENNDYESGKSKKRLTGTDSLSWKPKSWVVGVRIGPFTKAYDWNRLKSERIIHDEVKGIPLLLVMSADTNNFFVLKRPNKNDTFSLADNKLFFQNHIYNLRGKGIDTSFNLTPLQAYQEFWHSWKFFNPDTEK